MPMNIHRPTINGLLPILLLASITQLQAQTGGNGNRPPAPEAQTPEKGQPQTTGKGEPPSTDGGKAPQSVSSPRSFVGWIGYTRYKMSDFNAQLATEGNHPVRGNLNIGAEFAPLQSPVSIPKVPSPINLQILPMVGIEYLEAGSQTPHTIGQNSATVNWSLNVIGGYTVPADLAVGKYVTLRPVSIGYYWLGPKSRLTVTDRPGSLNASDRNVGFTPTARFIVPVGKNNENVEVFGEIGYRWLKFTNGTLTPANGFPISVGGSVATVSVLPQTLDYSGLILRFAVGKRF